MDYLHMCHKYNPLGWGGVGWGGVEGGGEGGGGGGGGSIIFSFIPRNLADMDVLILRDVSFKS